MIALLPYIGMFTSGIRERVAIQLPSPAFATCATGLLPRFRVWCLAFAVRRPMPCLD